MMASSVASTYRLLAPCLVAVLFLANYCQVYSYVIPVSNRQQPSMSVRPRVATRRPTSPSVSASISAQYKYLNANLRGPHLEATSRLYASEDENKDEESSGAESSSSSPVSLSLEEGGEEEEESAAVEESSSAADNSTDISEEETKKGLVARIKSAFKGNEEDDGLTFKQKLAKMGLSALLSYGFVSNMSYSVTVSLAWFGFSKKTGLSPLAPGQWKPFLAVYAGFYIFNNVIRPVRLAVSVGVTPYFDRAVAAVQRRTKLNKSASIGIVVFLANFCGTLTAMGSGILLASIASGVPIFPPRT
mmetsp:Transcript_33004/g.72787  ORF Transcript_33004/g.72787 Transcript_33004/m.72787 type:complete len:303 (-) Transcript_33004:1866-2774(-)